MHYPLTFTPDDNGTILVTCPLLPEVTSFGDGEMDAIGHGSEAVATAMADRITNRVAIPLPTGTVKMPFLNLDPRTVLKIGLHNAMVEDGMRKADLARKMEVHKPTVDRLLDLDHMSGLDQLEEALAALQRTIEVRVRAA